MLTVPVPFETRAQAVLRSPAYCLDAARRPNFQMHWPGEPTVTATWTDAGLLTFNLDPSSFQPTWRHWMTSPIRRLTLVYYPDGVDVFSFFDLSNHNAPGPVWLLYIMQQDDSFYSHVWSRTESDPDDPDPVGLFTYWLRVSSVHDVHPNMDPLNIANEGE